MSEKMLSKNINANLSKSKRDNYLSRMKLYQPRIDIII